MSIIFSLNTIIERVSVKLLFSREKDVRTNLLLRKALVRFLAASLHTQLLRNYQGFCL